MDKGKTWGWLPAQMPGVAKLMAEKKAQLGSDWVAMCWRRGVVEQQPGWFFAREGALAVGTPWADDPVIAEYVAARLPTGAAMVVLRPKESVDGAH